MRWSNSRKRFAINVMLHKMVSTLPSIINYKIALKAHKSNIKSVSLNADFKALLSMNNCKANFNKICVLNAFLKKIYHS